MVNEDGIAKLDDNQAKNRNDDEDIVPEISNGDQIQLESYKSIPEFSGVNGTYRPWRNQVVRRMKMIDDFKKHPKYEVALGIIRAKVTGAASNVLTNNKTAYNIVAIIRTPDSVFADHRPLYVVEAEMTSIKQLSKNLREFHDAINEALHLVISKIVHAYKQEEEHRSLVAEAQIKATRTFVVGLNSQMMRHILYGRKPGSLAEAFTIARTVYYDHQYTESQCYQNRQQRNQRQPNHNRSTQNSTQSSMVNKPGNVTTNEKKRENWRQPNQHQSRINQI